MGRITHPLPEQEIAEQVSALLNTHNELSYKRTFSDILNGKVDYIVETHGNQVIGVCGQERLNFQLSEIKHLSVNPKWRGKGIGKFMVKRCLEIIKTPLIYATVKKENIPSLSVFHSLNFKEVCVYSHDEHDVVMLVRPNSKWSQKPNWKSVSSAVMENIGKEVLSSPM